MKITKEKLVKIIKEELEKAIDAGEDNPGFKLARDVITARANELGVDPNSVSIYKFYSRVDKKEIPVAVLVSQKGNLWISYPHIEKLTAEKMTLLGDKIGSGLGVEDLGAFASAPRPRDVQHPDDPAKAQDRWRALGYNFSL